MDGSDGVVEDVGRRAVPAQVTRDEDGEVIGHRRGLVPVVGDQDGGGGTAVQRGAQVGGEVGAGGGVETGERLVEQQYAGLEGQRPRDAHALRFSAGQRPHVPVGELRDTERDQPRRRPCSGRTSGQAAEPQPARGVGRHGAAPQDRTLQHGGDGVPRTAGVTGAPSRRISPVTRCGLSRPSARSSVDLPAPFAPSTASVDPDGTCSCGTCSSCRLPTWTRRSRQPITGAAGPG